MGGESSLFDIIGPVIVGPSSSHTAGAVRIGLMAREIFGAMPKSAKFTLYNSYATTGKGHGSDKGLLGGVLGLKVDDSRIKNAFKLANDQGMYYSFSFLEDFSRHPNSVDIVLEGDTAMQISADSIGAGEIQITSINGYKFKLSGDFHTILIVYKDKPGMVSRVSTIIQGENVNIASMHVDRTEKGHEASMAICLDSGIDDNAIEKLGAIEDIYLVRKIEPLEK